MELFSLIESYPLETLLGVLSSLALGYLLRISFSQRQRLNSINQTIISAFTPELNRLTENQDKVIDVMDDTAYRKHEASIRDNLERLPFIQRYRLRKAWERLAYGENKEQGKFLCYEQYADCYSISENKKLRNLAIHRINSILKICA
ncbi:hypothetical protein [Endozoicomonas sp. ONNA1]|uniref:hypothetical protein n=1 Tax=Endozoicomonas sp. ONNA1 TaxID=2828740 RepID=UPI002147F9F8|nr:hypothetical protein [Endozoicomonas sp. ONNA1]